MTVGARTTRPEAANGYSGGLAGPATVALSVLVLAALSLALLAAGEAGGWLPTARGPRHGRWRVGLLFLVGLGVDDRRDDAAGVAALPERRCARWRRATRRCSRASPSAPSGFSSAFCSARHSGLGRPARRTRTRPGGAAGRPEPGRRRRVPGEPAGRDLPARLRAPFAILARHWRGGGASSERATSGVDYGLACVGCCLPVVLVMVVVGVHDVFWTVALAGVMAAQKNFSNRRALSAVFRRHPGQRGICHPAWHLEPLRLRVSGPFAALRTCPRRS